jgi:hypothetical protein
MSKGPGRETRVRQECWVARGQVMIMLSKIVIVLGLTSLAYLALRLVVEPDRSAALEQEVASQLEALREHLFKR